MNHFNFCFYFAEKRTFFFVALDCLDLLDNQSHFLTVQHEVLALGTPDNLVIL